MPFSLGSESRKIRTSDNTPILRKDLDNGVVAEANLDGSIYVDKSIDPNSMEFANAIAHEQVHLKQMEDERAAYGENWVMWEGKIYFRDNGYIDGPNGRWPEGDENHPWEQEAINAEII
mgnify:FL=1